MNWAPPGPGNVNSRRRFTEITMPDSGVVISPLSAVYRLEPSTNSNFNSLQLRAEKRFSHGLTFLSSYIWSKTISDGRGQSGAGGTSNINQQDPTNLAAERSLADEHRAHRFVNSFNYDLPFGRGRASVPASFPLCVGQRRSNGHSSQDAALAYPRDFGCRRGPRAASNSAIAGLYTPRRGPGAPGSFGSPPMASANARQQINFFQHTP